MKTSIRDHRQNVRELQQFLRVMHYDHPTVQRINPDGIFGPETTEAVKASQEIFGFVQTGRVDYPTWVALYDNYVVYNLVFPQS